MTRLRLILAIGSLAALISVSAVGAALTPAASPAAVSVGAVTQIKVTQVLKAQLRAAYVKRHGKLPRSTTGPVDGRLCYPVIDGPVVPGKKPVIRDVCTTFVLRAATFKGKSYALATFFDLKTYGRYQPERFVRGSRGWTDLGDSKIRPLQGIPCLVLRSWTLSCK